MQGFTESADFLLGGLLLGLGRALRATTAGMLTLLLRPFNFETLSTYVYQFATDELLEHSALAALAIVAAGLGPVIWMNASQRR